LREEGLMTYLKCTSCRARLYYSVATRGSGELCPGCGEMLEPVGELAEVVGYRSISCAAIPIGRRATHGAVPQPGRFL
jgi:hypothetical protein